MNLEMAKLCERKTFLSGSYYKIGRFSKAYRLSNGEWLRAVDVKEKDVLDSMELDKRRFRLEQKIEKENALMIAARDDRLEDLNKRVEKEDNKIKRAQAAIKHAKEERKHINQMIKATKENYAKKFHAKQKLDEESLRRTARDNDPRNEGIGDFDS